MKKHILKNIQFYPKKILPFKLQKINKSWAKKIIFSANKIISNYYLFCVYNKEIIILDNDLNKKCNLKKNNLFNVIYLNNYLYLFFFNKFIEIKKYDLNFKLLDTISLDIKFDSIEINSSFIIGYSKNKIFIYQLDLFNLQILDNFIFETNGTLNIVDKYFLVYDDQYLYQMTTNSELINKIHLEDYIIKKIYNQDLIFIWKKNKNDYIEIYNQDLKLLQTLNFDYIKYFTYSNSNLIVVGKKIYFYWLNHNSIFKKTKSINKLNNKVYLFNQYFIYDDLYYIPKRYKINNLSYLGFSSKDYFEYITLYFDNKPQFEKSELILGYINPESMDKINYDFEIFTPKYLPIDLKDDFIILSQNNKLLKPGNHCIYSFITDPIIYFRSFQNTNFTIFDKNINLNDNIFCLKIWMKPNTINFSIDNSIEILGISSHLTKIHYQPIYTFKLTDNFITPLYSNEINLMIEGDIRENLIDFELNYDKFLPQEITKKFHSDYKIVNNNLVINNDILAYNVNKFKEVQNYITFEKDNKLILIKKDSEKWLEFDDNYDDYKIINNMLYKLTPEELFIINLDNLEKTVIKEDDIIDFDVMDNNIIVLTIDKIFIFDNEYNLKNEIKNNYNKIKVVNKLIYLYKDNLIDIYNLNNNDLNLWLKQYEKVPLNFVDIYHDLPYFLGCKINKLKFKMKQGILILYSQKPEKIQLNDEELFINGLTKITIQNNREIDMNLKGNVIWKSLIYQLDKDYIIGDNIINTKKGKKTVSNLVDNDEIETINGYKKIKNVNKIIEYNKEIKILEKNEIKTNIPNQMVYLMLNQNLNLPENYLLKYKYKSKIELISFDVEEEEIKIGNLIIKYHSY